MTLASIVIPSRGGAERLPRLLGALSAQDDSEWEAIVVLDGDVDGSANVLDDYRAKLPLHVVVFPENRGRVAALNAGFSTATGEVLIRCDDDLEPAPDYVRRHKEAHAGDPVGVVGLYLNQLPPTPYARAYGVEADESFRQAAYGSPTPWRYWAGNCSVTRATWERVGPYDPAYRAYGWEDVDWGYRLHAAGIPVRLEPALETTHHVAAVTAHSRATRAFHSGAARRLFEDIHGTSVLPPAAPEASGWWNRAVLGVGRSFSRRSVESWARAVDSLALALPRPVSKKLIALLVEGGALAGYQHPDDTTTDL